MFFLSQSISGSSRIIFLFLILVSVYITKIQGQYLVSESILSPIIVIDPGHGGKDKGCHAHHYNEKDIALSLSMKIGKMVQKHIPQAQIIYTRNKDHFIKLKTRVSIANKYNPDVFISVHANSVDVPSVSGSEIFILGAHSDDEQRRIEKRENASSLIDNDLSYDDTFEAHMLASAAQSDNLSKSLELAQSIEHNLSMLNGHRCRGVKQANFTVLKNIASPSILLEAGYLTNDQDYKSLNSTSGQNAIADNVAESIKDFLIKFPRVDNSTETPVSTSTSTIYQKSISPSNYTTPANKPRSVIRNAKSMSEAEASSAAIVEDSYYLVLASSKTAKFSVSLPQEIDKSSKIIIDDQDQYYYLLGPYTGMNSATNDRTICINAGYKGTYLSQIDQFISGVLD